MANNANKKIIVKKDMNFFAEFTASASTTSYLRNSFWCCSCGRYPYLYRNRSCKECSDQRSDRRS